MTASVLSPAELSDLGAQAVAMAATVPPADADRMARVLLVDTLGALIGGLRYPAMQSLRRDLARAGGEFARLMTLGTAATWLDADSGGSIHPRGDRLPPVPTAHPAPHVLPVVLDAAYHGADDRNLLAAFTVGTELGMRLGAGSTLRLGLHPHGIHGPAGAAVARALLRGGDAAATARAFARGASLPLAALLAVPMAGGTVRNAWTGLGSYYGALAGTAALTEREAPEDAARVSALFDHAVCDELDRDVLLGTSDQWRLRSSYLKPYACARWIHPALDALAAGLREHPGAEVARIEVRTFAFAVALAGNAPESDMAARFSLPFSLATLATDGRLAADGFLPGLLDRPQVRALAARVTVTEDPAFTAALPRERPTTVRAHFTDGTSAEAHVRNARGNPSDPLGDDLIAAKLRANAGDLVSPALLNELVRWLGERPGETRVLQAVARELLDA